MSEQINPYILSILILFPVLGVLAVVSLPHRVARMGALAVAGLNFIFSLHLVAMWNSTIADGGYKYSLSLPWVPQMGLSLHLGVDGLGAALVVLTAFITPIALLFGWNEIQTRLKSYLVCILLLEAAAIGVFSALDVILFYVFFEAVLIPAYILIVGWGGEKRGAAAIKLFGYTMFGSVFFWIAMLYLYFQQTGTRSFDIAAMMNVASQTVDQGSPNIALWCFAAFAIAFAIKTPLFPFHTWQPAAYEQSPTGATIMLAAILSKMGTFGFVRFAVPFFPNASTVAAPTVIALALASVVYGAFVAMRQTEIKRVFAYSSLSHLGFVVLGIFAAKLANENGAIATTGANIQMLAHGISTAALFGVAGMLWQRRGTLVVDQFGGLAGVMPRFTSLFWIALFASVGLPGLCNFVGEYLILQGTIAANFWYAAIAATGVIWGAIYMLKMFREVMFGEVTVEANRSLPDATKRETFALAVLIAAAVWIGIAPQPVLQAVSPSIEQAPAATTPPVAMNMEKPATKVPEH